MTALLKLSGLGLSYQTDAGPVPALSAINLTLEKNEFATVVGSPGSGKTTLTNVIAGFERHDSGHYSLLGRDASRLGADTWAGIRARHIGLVLRRPAFLEDAPLIRNVTLPLLATKMAYHLRTTKALSVLRSLDLEAQAYEQMANLTSDQVRRAALACALIIDSAFILADEPTADLDPASRALVLDLLSAQRELGRAVLVVTEDQALADRADTAYILENGSFIGEPVSGRIPQKVAEAVHRTVSVPTGGANSQRTVLGPTDDTYSHRTASVPTDDMHSHRIALGPTDGPRLQANLFNPAEVLDLEPGIREVEREARSIFGDLANWRPILDECGIPIDVSVDTILSQNFVQEEWWRPRIR